MSFPLFTNSKTAQYANYEPVFKSIVLAKHYGVDEEVIEYYKKTHTSCFYYRTELSGYDILRQELVGIGRRLKIKNIKDRYR